jgi:hypothetical protein
VNKCGTKITVSAFVGPETKKFLSHATLSIKLQTILEAKQHGREGVIL